MILQLDYKTPVRMQATTDVERTARINACKKEPETVAWIESLPPGKVLFDIGANVGSYSFVASANGLKVFAFEPSGPTFERLEENVNLNLNLPVFAHPVLLGDEDKLVPFSRSSDEPGAALHKLGYSPRAVQMRMFTLDDYVQRKHLPWPYAMKIDVDGNELRVLIGAQLALSHCQTLQVELDGSPMSERVHDFLGERSFAQTKVTKHEWSGVSNCVYERFEVA